HTMLTLVQIYLDQRKNAEAEALAKEILARMEGNVGELTRVRSRANINYARALMQNKKYAEAEQAYARVKAYLDVTPDEMQHRRSYYSGMGRVHFLNGNYVEAGPLLERALELTVTLKGEYSPHAARVKSYLAQNYAKQGNYEQALTTYRAAMAAGTSFLAQRETFSKAGRAQQEAAIQRYLFGFMNLMVNAHQSGQQISTDPVSESFTIAENARGQSLQSAMLGMTARAAARNDYLSELVRKEQDLRLQIGTIEEQIIEKVKAGAVGIKALGRSRREKIRELKRIGEEMSYQYPEYNRLVNPPATRLSDVQTLLTEDELMLSYFIQKDRTVLWIVSRDKAEMHVVPLGADDVQNKVQQLRASLDVPIATVDDIPAYDVKLAHELYQALIAPAGERLQKAKHLILVPHRALLSMPFGALVTAKTGVKKAVLPFAGYRNVPWLAQKYAISIMPSATALVTMRKYAKGEKPEQPFIGFGDPVFSEDSTQATVATRGVRVAQRAVINTRNIKGLPNLPETRTELQKIALTLGAAEDSLFLGEAANEPNVKGADLQDYRVVAFATHGLVAGDLDGLEQPALALTPPTQGTEDNDGLLQMGEVLGLDLNADWVVLSACNTASGDKSLANEGLTGLTQAFFYAGSKALLVSLWPVESTSTQALTTTMFGAANNDPNLGRAAALQAARKQLIEGKGYMREGKEVFSYAHPIFWSAFIAVGEGGVN
ncbi:MAG: CHAT domain-containing protein, partial [Granulosicoccaceae bacterium]